VTDRIALRPRDAARLLGVRPETVRELCRRGELPAREISPGRWLISREALESWVRGEAVR